MSPLRRLFVLMLWGAVATAYVAAILPRAEAPHIGGWDKTDHMTAFLVVTMLARLAYPRTSPPRLFALIVAFGGLIEATQALPIVGRDAEWGDWLADGIATLAGLILAWPLAMLAQRRRMRRLASEQPIDREAQPQP